MAWITTGTITVSPGSDVVTGAGTAWLTHQVQAGWALQVGGVHSEIAAVVSETELRLARPYEGSAVVDGGYQILQIAAVAQSLIDAVREQNTSVQGHLDGALAGRFEGGNSAEPGIAFKDAPSTGLGLTDDGEVVLTIGGVDVAAFDPLQNLVLGSATALTRLHVQKDVEFDPQSSVEAATAFLRGGSRNALGAFGGALALSKPNSTRPGAVVVAKQTSDDADQVGLSVFVHGDAASNEATQEVFTVDHDGRVGINKGAPVAALDVAGEARFQGTNDSNTDIQNINRDGTQSWSWFSGGNLSTGFYNVTSQRTPFRVDHDAASNALTVTGTGVGVGAVSPDHALHIASSGVDLLHIDRAGQGNAGAKYSNNDYALYAGMDPFGEFSISPSVDIGSEAVFSMNVVRGQASIKPVLGTQGRRLEISDPNADYNSTMVHLESARAASGNFNFMRCFANGVADLMVNLKGDGSVDIAGQISTTGADYTEFFEWEDGNPSGEDRRGVSVVLEGDKIRPAADGEVPFGVISATASLIGDADMGHWKGKYLRDELGSPVLEDYEVISWEAFDDESGVVKVQQFASDGLPDGVSVPDDATRSWGERYKLNPDFNPDLKYTRRADRPEWACVGFLGKLRVRKGQPTAPGWIKMREVSDAVEEWLVK